MENKKFALDKLQKKTLSLFADSPLAQKFYWTGGTALTYFYLRHRKSEDIDFFSDNSFYYEELISFIKSIRKYIPLKKIEEKKIYSRYEFFLHNDSKLRLEFVHYDFTPLKKRKKWNGIYIDSLSDMAANKTMAMLNRHDPKDAIDIYYLIHKNLFSPDKLLALVKKKFGITFPLSSFWDRALLSSKTLNSISPLLYGNNRSSKKIIDTVTSYFELEGAKELHKYLFG